MHGLVNRAVQCFLRDTYGVDRWLQVARIAGFGGDGFDTMAIYDQPVTDALIDAAAQMLDRPRDLMLEDMGTYLVSHPTVEPLRRLLRFGGATFMDFLLSLEDLPGRCRLAVPDLDIPGLALEEAEADVFLLHCRSPLRGAGHVMTGLMRAMADDYGALVLLDHLGAQDGVERLRIHVLETSFAAGRQFDLARGTVRVAVP
jgi:Haem-NO-binding